MVFGFKKSKESKDKQSSRSGGGSSEAGSSAGASGSASRTTQETYNLAEYDSDEDDDDVPDENLQIAAFVMAKLFDETELSGGKNLEYAMIGGFALRCRGSKRKTNDLDFSVNIEPRELWNVLTSTELAKKRLVSMPFHVRC